MKPMLAVNAPDIGALAYPLALSPKLDGVRCLIHQGQALSRTLKPIPNECIQEWVRRHADALQGFDGELIVGDPTDEACIRNTVSGVMTHRDEPEFQFFVFDRWDRGTRPFKDVLELPVPDIARLVHHRAEIAMSPVEVEALEESYLDQGYEGAILRHLVAGYKFGRSTAREQGMLKLKRFTTAEAQIIGFEPLMHNANEATTNALGRTERSSHQENLVPLDLLGAFHVEQDGMRFKIGTGMTADQRAHFWATRESLIGEWAAYKFFPVGVKDKPRHPVFSHIRPRIDI